MQPDAAVGVQEECTINIPLNEKEQDSSFAFPSSSWEPPEEAVSLTSVGDLKLAVLSVGCMSNVTVKMPPRERSKPQESH